jgi:hypothetical protein
MHFTKHPSISPQAHLPHYPHFSASVPAQLPPTPKLPPRLQVAASYPQTAPSHPRLQHSQHLHPSAHAPRPATPESGIRCLRAKGPEGVRHARLCRQSILSELGGARRGIGRGRVGRQLNRLLICRRAGGLSLVGVVWGSRSYFRYWCGDRW